MSISYKKIDQTLPSSKRILPIAKKNECNFASKYIEVLIKNGAHKNEISRLTGVSCQTVDMYCLYLGMQPKPFNGSGRKTSIQRLSDNDKIQTTDQEIDFLNDLFDRNPDTLKKLVDCYKTYPRDWGYVDKKIVLKHADKLLKKAAI